MNKKVFTVSQINKYVKNILEDDIILSDIFVEGEISNLKYHNSGCIYFTLKDIFSSINCIIFKQNNSNINLENGIKVIVYGKVNLYEKTGKYQLYIELIEPLGKGEVFVSFEQLKDKLNKKGYFDNSKKKFLPSNPKIIALITSPTGAAVEDMIKISRRRNKAISLAIIPTLVQGEGAAESIVNSINIVNEWNKADIIILGRGGGSIEDLSAFNTELVAEAIYNSNIPIISAVGHEIDFTISDFVADIRASTPSSAIEISVPDINNNKYIIKNYLKSLNETLYNRYIHNKYILNKIYNNKTFLYINKNLYNKKFNLNVLITLLNKEINFSIKKENTKLNNLILLLKNTSPLNVLKRGYSIVYKDKYPIKSIKNIKLNDNISIKLKDGNIKANINYIKIDDFKKEI